MSIIDKVYKKIKDIFFSKWTDDLFWILLVIFVAIGSFSLGVRYQRESSLAENSIKITQNKNIEIAWKNYIKNKKSNANFFASKNGTVYYPLGCPSGNRIDEKNRVYFENEDDAIDAGYRQSARCN